MSLQIKILVLGGYGNVGKNIVSILYRNESYIISVCGRNFEKAKKVSQQFDNRVIPFQLDAQSFYNYIDFINAHDIVICCLDLTSSKLPKHILENGKIYIDLTANISFIQKVNKLNQIALNNGGTAMMCVGLVPGLSNLMVKYLYEKFPYSKEAEIFVQLGLGDKNGKSAVHWVLDNILSDYHIQVNHKTEKKTPFRNGVNEKLFGRLGRFYPFNFADQHIVVKTSGITKAVSYLGFDIAWFTRYISLLKRFKLIEALRFKLYYRFISWLFLHVKFGKPEFMIKVKVKTESGDNYSISVSGSNEAIVTAQVASELVEWVINQRNELQRGITFIENHLDFMNIISELKLNTIEE